MSGKRRLWLHVGPAKTGTRSIQNSLWAGRDRLSRHGVSYIKPIHTQKFGKARFNHHSLAKALRDGAYRFVEKSIAAIPDAPDTVISSEGFAKCDRRQFADLKAMLDDRFDVTAIFYARDPVARANSQAQQSIKSGKKSYDDLSRQTLWASLEDEITRLVRVFGRDRVRVRHFDRAAFPNGCLIADVLTAIDRPDLIGEVEVITANEGMTLETALAIDAHRRKTGDRSVIRGDDPRFATGTTRFALPAETLERIAEQAGEDVAWLKAEWGIDLWPRRDRVA